MDYDDEIKRLKIEKLKVEIELLRFQLRDHRML